MSDVAMLMIVSIFICNFKSVLYVKGDTSITKKISQCELSLDESQSIVIYLVLIFKLKKHRNT